MLVGGNEEQISKAYNIYPSYCKNLVGVPPEVVLSNFQFLKSKLTSTLSSTSTSLSPSSVSDKLSSSARNIQTGNEVKVGGSQQEFRDVTTTANTQCHIAAITNAQTTKNTISSSIVAIAPKATASIQPQPTTPSTTPSTTTSTPPTTSTTSTTTSTPPPTTSTPPTIPTTSTPPITSTRTFALPVVPSTPSLPVSRDIPINDETVKVAFSYSSLISAFLSPDEKHASYSSESIVQQGLVFLIKELSLLASMCFTHSIIAMTSKPEFTAQIKSIRKNVSSNPMLVYKEISKQIKVISVTVQRYKERLENFLKVVNGEQARRGQMVYVICNTALHRGKILQYIGDKLLLRMEKNIKESELAVKKDDKMKNFMLAPNDQPDRTGTNSILIKPIGDGFLPSTTTNGITNGKYEYEKTSQKMQFNPVELSKVYDDDKRSHVTPFISNQFSKDSFGTQFAKSSEGSLSRSPNTDPKNNSYFSYPITLASSSSSTKSSAMTGESNSSSIHMNSMNSNYPSHPTFSSYPSYPRYSSYHSTSNLAPDQSPSFVYYRNANGEIVAERRGMGRMGGRREEEGNYREGGSHASDRQEGEVLVDELRMDLPMDRKRASLNKQLERLLRM